MTSEPLLCYIGIGIRLVAWNGKIIRDLHWCFFRKCFILFFSLPHKKKAPIGIEICISNDQLIVQLKDEIKI